LLPVAAVVAEGWNLVPHWSVAPAPVRLASLRQPVLVLPSAQIADYHLMLWSTDGWPVIANGDSGFNAAAQIQLRAEVLDFPSAASVSALRRRGVATVVLVPSRIGSEPGALWGGALDRPITGLGITRADLPDAVIYDVRPEQ
jgi:hypothetical protein